MTKAAERREVLGLWRDFVLRLSSTPVVLPVRALRWRPDFSAGQSHFGTDGADPSRRSARHRVESETWIFSDFGRTRRLRLHYPAESPYLRGMLVRRTRTDGFVDPCIPTRAAKPPVGHVWVHKIKHAGYRLILRREGDTVRLFTRRGYDWTDRYPAIARAAAKLRAKSFTIDGEAALCGPDGVANFDALHRRGSSTTRGKLKSVSPSARRRTHFQNRGPQD